MKVGDLVEHTVFTAQRAGIIIKVGSCNGVAVVHWTAMNEAHTESLFLLRLVDESR